MSVFEAVQPHLRIHEPDVLDRNRSWNTDVLQRGDQQVGYALYQIPRPVQQEHLFHYHRHRRLPHLIHMKVLCVVRANSCHCQNGRQDDRRTTVQPIVEDRGNLRVVIDDFGDSVSRIRTVDVNEHVRCEHPQRSQQLIPKKRNLISPSPSVCVTPIVGIYSHLLVVSARVENNAENSLRMKSSHSCVQDSSTHCQSCRPSTQVSNIQGVLAVSNHDRLHFSSFCFFFDLSDMTGQHSFDLSSVIHVEMHHVCFLRNFSISLTCRLNSMSVIVFRHLLHIFSQERGQEKGLSSMKLAEN
mmetsp:Transcript_11862/g.27371  ORF Transcript_11862/g.27371 Transcript_11862/m.27371 type:complete len:299 (+) Transcript_11862:837-1733(+)